MLLFGVSFNMYYLLLIKRWREVLKSNELKCYLGISLAAMIIVALSIMPLYGSIFGGCMGSTAGGLKMSRVTVLAQIARNDLRRALRPREVSSVILNGRRVDAQGERQILSYFALYIAVIGAVFLLISFELREQHRPRLRASRPELELCRLFGVFKACFVICHAARQA